MLTIIKTAIGRYSNMILAALLVYAVAVTGSTMFYHKRATEAKLEYQIAKQNYNKLLENMRLSNEIVSASAAIKTGNATSAKSTSAKITDVHVFSDNDVDSLREYTDTINNRHTGRTNTASHN